jgi:hypothetical protein
LQVELQLSFSGTSEVATKNFSIASGDATKKNNIIVIFAL